LGGIIRVSTRLIKRVDIKTYKLDFIRIQL